MGEPREVGESVTEKWCLGATSPKKVVHRRRCASARADYTWARQFDSIDALANALVDDGAWRWHRYCQRCCGDLDDAVRAVIHARAKEWWEAEKRRTGDDITPLDAL